MAVVMFLVRRLLRFAHREKGQHCRAGVHEGVPRLGQQRKRARPQTGRELRRPRARALAAIDALAAASLTLVAARGRAFVSVTSTRHSNVGERQP